MGTKVFISYSHDNDDYKDWVRSFADRLIVEGVEVTLDQYDLKLGDSTPLFMEKSVTDCDYVLILITQEYVKKANERKAGVGYETDLVSGEILVYGNRKKFIPIFIKIDYKESPVYLRGTNA